MAQDILPDSRAREVRGSIRSPLGNLVPIYCANCGRRYGMVNAELIPFVFALCDTACVEKHGHAAHLMEEPDAAFWATCAEEQAKAGVTTPEDVARLIEAGSNSIATLAADWAAKLRMTI
jgi:hypothetical protein